MLSYYRLLGVSRGAPLGEIRDAYWSLSRRISQECGTASRETRLTEIRRAFETLSSAARRREYDARRVTGEGASPRRLGGWGLTGNRDDSVVPREFPSMSGMGDVAPRIYQAFFGKDPAAPANTHVMDVQLSPAQACSGTRVPLVLSVHPLCPMCGGRGELWPQPCGVCLGSGAGSLSHDLQVPVPAGVRDGECLRFAVTPPFSSETQIELRIVIH